MNKTEVIQYAQNTISRVDSQVRLIGRLPEDWNYYFLNLGEKLFIEITTLEELHSIRQELRRVFNSWEDRMSSVYVPYGTTVWVNWRGVVEEQEIKIRLTTSIEKFPSLNINPDSDCHFEKEESVTEEGYRYVCNK